MLLEAVRQSDSPVLLPLLILAIDTGLRASEARSLRRKDLELTWEDGTIVAGRLIVPSSKTEAGRGRCCRPSHASPVRYADVVALSIPRGNARELRVSSS